MEFSNRGGQPAANQGAHHAPASSKRKKLAGSKAMRIVSVVLLVSAALLIGAVAILTGVGGKTEAGMVKKDHYQAVFLNGGQVYFGKIKDMNSKYVTIDSIYYLRVNQQVQPNQSQDQAQQNVSLAKLGCELHGPEDYMVINREQVTFWENLKDDGQVVKAITEFVKANPQGQKCEQPAANSSSNTTPTTTTPPPAASTKK